MTAEQKARAQSGKKGSKDKIQASDKKDTKETKTVKESKKDSKPSGKTQNVNKEVKATNSLDDMIGNLSISKGQGKKQGKGKKQAPEPTTNTNSKGGYLADYDLPSSESEDEEVDVETERQKMIEQKKQEKMNFIQDQKEKKKMELKERAMVEKVAREKASLLRDDNVFDVAYEGMGTGVVLSYNDIKVNNFTMRAKGKTLLENTQLTITMGRRYGLVGPNGKGKSTLLRMIAERRLPTPDNMDILLVEQEVVGDETVALEAVIRSDVKLMALQDEADRLEKQLEDEYEANKEEGDQQGIISSQLNEVYEEIQKQGGQSAEARASKILHGLGFTERMQKMTTQSFSGGWRMRISLARALYIKPTVLLLDEPTNHLDLRASLWLQQYLTRWKKTLLIVSHDREFLDIVTTDIIHLHEEQLDQYKGNYTDFQGMFEQKKRVQIKDYEKFQKQVHKAKQSGEKKNTDKVEEKARKTSRKDKGKTSSDTQEVKALPKRWRDYTVKFEFPQPPELPSPVIQINDVIFRYPSRDDFELKNVNQGIHMTSRISIVGPNGGGKSTLMNLIAGDSQPTEGEVRINPKLRIGRYAQHFVDALSMEDTPVEYLLNRYPESGLKDTEIRAKLGRFGLSGAHHLVPIIKLSGGQKSRVVFTSISMANPHILLLDEPTNHLDMESIEALADAINQFEGGVVVISHDSQLLSSICDNDLSEVWIVEDGEVKVYKQEFEDYKEELIEEINNELDDDEVKTETLNQAPRKLRMTAQ